MFSSMRAKKILVVSALGFLTACGQTAMTETDLPKPTPLVTVTSSAVTSLVPTVIPLQTVSSVGVPASAIKAYSMASVPFGFSYPQDWTINQDAATSVSVSSPSTMHDRQTIDVPGFGGECVTCQPNFVISYFPTIADETSNKLGHFGATSFNDLLKKDATLKVLGKTTVANHEALEVVQGGFTDVYAIYVTQGEGLYEIIFPQRTQRSELSAQELAILASLQLSSPKSGAILNGGVGASLQQVK